VYGGTSYNEGVGKVNSLKKEGLKYVFLSFLCCFGVKIQVFYPKKYKSDSLNTRYTLRRLTAARGSALPCQSLPAVARSHANLHPHCQPLG